MIEASKPKSKSTKKSYLLLIKNTKNNNDNVWDVDIMNLWKKNSTKNWGTLWTEITRSPVFSHRKQVNIQSAIYTCTYTYNYDKVRASYIYARKKPFYGKLFLPLWLAGFLSSACKLEFLVFWGE